jgi:hypothetical protein
LTVFFPPKNILLSQIGESLEKLRQARLRIGAERSLKLRSEHLPQAHCLTNNFAGRFPSNFLLLAALQQLALIIPASSRSQLINLATPVLVRRTRLSELGFLAVASDVQPGCRQLHEFVSRPDGHVLKQTPIATKAARQA